MERRLLCGLVLSLVSIHIICGHPCHQNKSPGKGQSCSPGQGGNQDLGQDLKTASPEHEDGGQDLKQDFYQSQIPRGDAGPDQRTGVDECCRNTATGRNVNKTATWDQNQDQNQDTSKNQHQGSSKDQSQDSSQNKMKIATAKFHQGQGNGQNCKKGKKHDHSSVKGPKKGSGEDHSRDTGEDKSQETKEDNSRETEDDKSKGSGEDQNKGSGEDQNNGLDPDQNNSLDPDQNNGSGEDKSQDNHLIHCGSRPSGVSDARSCLEDVTNILRSGNRRDTIQAMESLEQALEETEVNETTSLSVNNLIALLFKPRSPFQGLEIYASESEVTLDKSANNSKVNVRLPRELKVGSNNTIVFFMLTWPGTNESSDVLFENRLVALSVRGKKISGLRERVNITMSLAVGINETQEPRCVFLDFSTQNFSEGGCRTVWGHGQSHVTCSCDHFTYFGVLLVSADLPPEHLEILSYITLIGCSLSLLVLVITVLLFIVKRKVRADVSMKVHINLAFALILLNLHFLPSQQVAALASSGLCLYFGLALHYSLLATFSWTAVEGFHLYLLLVRVFNIYIRRYLLKLSLLGWGVPVVIVSLVVAIDREAYGVFPLDSSNPNSTEICYIVNNTVKMVTTVGAFSLVFFFNLIMLGVAIRRVVCLRRNKQSGQIDGDRVKQNICTLLGVTVLLGIPWGLVFFSFGYLTVPGLYAFCILNSLQGFFVFLWFLMSLRKIRNSAAVTTGSKTQSSNS